MSLNLELKRKRKKQKAAGGDHIDFKGQRDSIPPVVPSWSFAFSCLCLIDFYKLRHSEEGQCSCPLMLLNLTPKITIYSNTWWPHCSEYMCRGEAGNNMWEAKYFGLIEWRPHLHFSAALCIREALKSNRNVWSHYCINGQDIHYIMRQ